MLALVGLRHLKVVHPSQAATKGWFHDLSGTLRFVVALILKMKMVNSLKPSYPFEVSGTVKCRDKVVRTNSSFAAVFLLGRLRAQIHLVVTV